MHDFSDVEVEEMQIIDAFISRNLDRFFELDCENPSLSEYLQKELEDGLKKIYDLFEAKIIEE